MSPAIDFASAVEAQGIDPSPNLEAIEEGIYLLKNKATGQVLTYHSNGTTKAVTLTCRDQEDDSASPRFARQRWLVARRLDANDGYQLINHHFGIFAGIFHKQRSRSSGTAHVQAAPCALDDPNTGWSVVRKDNSCFEVIWQPKTVESRVLSVHNGKKNGYITIEQPSAASTQQWHLIPSHPPSLFPTYLTHIPSTHLLSQLSLPATHQSAATMRTFIENPRCQEQSITEQLHAGIRMLDLRFGVLSRNGERPCLYARHGSPPFFIDEVQCLGAILQQLIVFLLQNKGEVVLVKVANEDRSEGFAATFEADLQCILDMHPQCLYDFTKGTQLHTVRLGDVRGKIVFLCADRGGDAVWAAKELSSTATIDGMTYLAKETNFLDCVTRSGPGHEDCAGNVARAVADHAPEHGYMQSWNDSRFPFTRRDPRDFAILAREYIRASGVYGPENIGVGGSHARVGIVLLDFHTLVQRDCVAHVVRANAGCELLGLPGGDEDGTPSRVES